MPRTAESEKTVEAYLVKRMKELGGKAYKWVSPGNDGVPDRLCVFPGARVEMVELKGKGGALTSSQKKRFPELARFGRRIWILWSRAEVDRFLEHMGGDGGAVCTASVSELLYQPPVD